MWHPELPERFRLEEQARSQLVAAQRSYYQGVLAMISS